MLSHDAATRRDFRALGASFREFPMVEVVAAEALSARDAPQLRRAPARITDTASLKPRKDTGTANSWRIAV